ncbi:MAG: hypothetical protein A2146_03305 [Actinobacteria bacterium RBG_16_67_10]|nr:MAG: hypothetical protein A2146_03305 [Actinobacteria bacterium RBG_16_67_10]
MVDRTAGSKPRLHATFVGLLPYIEQDAVARSIGCGGTPSAGNRVFGVHGIADANGDVAYDRMLSPDIDFGAVKSVWIDIDQTPTCAISFNFETLDVAAGDVNGDGAAGLVDNNSNSLVAMALVERRAQGRARLTIVIHTGDGNDEFSVRGVNRACGKSPTHTAFTVEFVGGSVASFKSKIVDMSQAELDGLRSMRVHNMSTGQSWCAPLGILIALLVP